MRKTILGFNLLFCFSLFSQTNAKLEAYAQETAYNNQKQLNFIKLKESHQINESEVAEFINLMVLNNGSNKVAVLKSDKDALGFTHIKYSILYKGTLIFNKLIIAHIQNGKLISLNGDLQEIKTPSNSFSMSEKNALNSALTKINAKVYKWQIKAEEEHMRETLKQPDFTYYPKGIKVVYEKDNKFHYAWEFKIYAQEPLSHANVFVDATTGKILGEQNLICNADVTSTVLTKYSGTQTVTTDQNGPTFRLREVARGLGIQTFNMGNTMTYSSTDFTNATTSWTTIIPDQPARDAHWGAENTYDYYMNIHNRNSIDGAGYQLLSYVHYSTNYNNAFWDGIRMTYGDGDGAVFTVLTSQDVCGHEITHGLVENTAALNGGEADALNEGYADIFGTSIERYRKPGTWDWKMGAEITPSGNGIRNLLNPNLLNDPDTYLGTYWDPGGEPHNNSTPISHCFYLMVAGGTGTNDINNAYTVTPLGNVDAEKIAFRALTVYFTPGTDYANARVCNIQAAKDLFGSCSNQVIQTTNAFYAIGVGAAYAPGAINPNFTANTNTICILPAPVNFNNLTQNGLSYTWYFGDGATSTSTNPVHSYTANGTYNVKLKALGCLTGSDSLTLNSYILINAPASATTTGAGICVGGTVNLTANGTGTLDWYASPGSTVVLNTGTNYATPNLTNTTTYYVVNSTANVPVTGGIPSSTAVGTSGGYLNNNAQYLIFDVIQSGTLQTVIAYAQAAGVRTIELRNSANVVLYSSGINMALGINTLTLNYPLTPGTNYQLGTNGGSLSNMFRTNTGVAFPYAMGGIVNITGSSAGSAFYYWYYNWKVQKANCVSAAVPVTASVNPLPNLVISVPSTTVCLDGGVINLTGSPAGGVFSGPGITGATFDPSVGVGSYNVVYNYTDGNSCSNSTTLTLNVNVCSGIASINAANQYISIFPNPATDVVMIKSAADMKLKITDAVGKLILDKSLISNEEKINTSIIAKGLYFISLQNAAGKLIKTGKLIIE